jgi:multicopper oxidase
MPRLLRPRARRRVLLFALVAATSLRAQNVVDVVLHATPSLISLGGGAVGNAWTYDGLYPGPAIYAQQGDTLRVRFVNDLPTETIVHWHGLPVPRGMDGMPMLSRPAVAPGQEFLYELPNLPSGTYWYHSHVGTQIDAGLKGPVIVTAAPGQDPTSDKDFVVLLDRWINPIPGATPAYLGHVVNGKQSSAAAPFVVSVGETARLRFINGSGAQNYVVAVDQHPMTVTHADGRRVQPYATQALPIGTGERYDVLVTCSYPGKWSVAAATIQNRNAVAARVVLEYAGSTAAAPSTTFVPAFLSTGTLLDPAQLTSFDPTPTTATPPDRVYSLVLGQGGGQWLLNGEAWPAVTPFLASYGEEIEFTIQNATAVHHPMHVHGHYFRVVGGPGGPTFAPLRDSILIAPQGQPGSTVTARLLADNPGSWMLHCHHIGHSETGMIALFDYDGDFDGDGIPDAYDMDAQDARPTLTIPSTASSYLPGATTAAEIQWTLGETAFLFLGVEAAAPNDLGALGTLLLDLSAPIVPIASGVVGSGYVASTPGFVPSDPTLSGVRVMLQGIATTAITPYFRLSNPQALTVL